ncbi:hypothetical protein HJFPF1_00637 [Paramyrothecium foliicola]|nr:hypothetical protein HJFPF1_00637 [Paramyrothecium foliicola]
MAMDSEEQVVRNLNRIVGCNGVRGIGDLAEMRQDTVEKRLSFVQTKLTPTSFISIYTLWLIRQIDLRIGALERNGGGAERHKRAVAAAGAVVERWYDFLIQHGCRPSEVIGIWMECSAEHRICNDAHRARLIATLESYFMTGRQNMALQSDTGAMDIDTTAVPSGMGGEAVCLPIHPVSTKRDASSQQEVDRPAKHLKLDGDFAELGPRRHLGETPLHVQKHRVVLEPNSQRAHISKSLPAGLDPDMDSWTSMWNQDNETRRCSNQFKAESYQTNTSRQRELSEVCFSGLPPLWPPAALNVVAPRLLPDQLRDLAETKFCPDLNCGKEERHYILDCPKYSLDRIMPFPGISPEMSMPLPLSSASPLSEGEIPESGSAGVGSNSHPSLSPYDPSVGWVQTTTPNISAMHLAGRLSP